MSNDLNYKTAQMRVAVKILYSIFSLLLSALAWLAASAEESSLALQYIFLTAALIFVIGVPFFWLYKIKYNEDHVIHMYLSLKPKLNKWSNIQKIEHHKGMDVHTIHFKNSESLNITPLLDKRSELINLAKTKLIESKF